MVLTKQQRSDLRETLDEMKQGLIKVRYKINTLTTNVHIVGEEAEQLRTKIEHLADKIGQLKKLLKKRADPFLEEPAVKRMCAE